MQVVCVAGRCMSCAQCWRRRFRALLPVLLLAAHLLSNELALGASVAYCSCIQRKVACLLEPGWPARSACSAYILEPGWPGAACVGDVHVVSGVQSMYMDCNL
jgi:hypothetical protein